MLARYKIFRGRRPADEPLPNGVRMDTRKHTRHCLRPTTEIVTAYLAQPTTAAWKKFKAEYQRLLAARFDEDRTPFDHLAELAAENDVYIGCSCPTVKNPNVNHCHTMIALQFMEQHYDELEVTYPRGEQRE